MMLSSANAAPTSAARDRSADAVRDHRAAMNELLRETGCAAESRHFRTKRPPLDVHALVAGHGRPALLVHGGFGWAALWAPLMARLQQDHRLIAPELPGHGLTDAFAYERDENVRATAVDFLGSTMDELGLERAPLVASSMGAWWSLAFALAHPERVERLVLIGAPGGVGPWCPPFLRLLSTPVLRDILGGTIARPGMATTRTMFKQSLVADIKRVPEALLRCHTATNFLPGGHASRQAMMQRFVSLRGWRRELILREELPKIRAPTLFLWPEKDIFVPLEAGREVAREMGARFEVVPDAGHLPWLDQPEACAQHIRAFLGASAARGTGSSA